ACARWAPRRREPLDKVVVFVPVADADAVRRALAEAGTGRIGRYDSASFTSPGEGRFRPLDGAAPAIGSVGELEVVGEVRVEVVSAREDRESVVAAILAAHPYEEAAYAVVELASTDEPARGQGRIGTLAAPMTLREFADHVAHVLPATAHGVRVAGDPDQQVRTVALCGGAGDFLLDQVRRTDADVYLTSDLRHHPASEFREHLAPRSGRALVDVAHWAAEWTWLPVLRRKLAAVLGDTVEVRVSTTPTDPWTLRVDPTEETPRQQNSSPSSSCSTSRSSTRVSTVSPTSCGRCRRSRSSRTTRPDASSSTSGRATCVSPSTT